MHYSFMMTERLIRHAAAASLALCLTHVSSADENAGRAFIAQHCADCHDADAKQGGFDITALKADFAKAENFATWVKVHDVIQSGEMPPKKKARPPEAERAAFLAGLGKELTTAEAVQLAADGGRTSVRRMNRTEYEHALRDLLALPLLRVKDLLPEDGQKFGFDKVAGALDISHVQMTKYLQAADVALRQAVVPMVAHPETTKWREPAMHQDSSRGAIPQKCAVPLNGRGLAPGLKSHIAGDPVADYGNSYRAPYFDGEAESLAVLTGVIGAHQPEGIQMDRFRPTVPGWYRVRFSTWSLRWERTKAVAAVRGMVTSYTSFGLPFIKDSEGRWQATPLPPEKLTIPPAPRATPRSIHPASRWRTSMSSAAGVTATASRAIPKRTSPPWKSSAPPPSATARGSSSASAAKWTPAANLTMGKNSPT